MLRSNPACHTLHNTTRFLCELRSSRRPSLEQGAPPDFVSPLAWGLGTARPRDILLTVSQNLANLYLKQEAKLSLG